MVTHKDYCLTVIDQAIEQIDYLIAHNEEDGLRQVAEYLCKKMGEKGYYEAILYLFDFSSRYLVDKQKWIMKINRRLMEVKKEKI